MKRERNHVKYMSSGGFPVVGTTTVLQLLNKPALVAWAWRLGVEGKDYRAVSGNACDVGTLTHLLCECDMKGETPDLIEYSTPIVERAQKAFGAFVEFRKVNHVLPIKNEMQLISEEYLYGGTIDAYCELNGHKTLLDFKTGGYYPEHRLQMAAYRNLLIENGHPVEKVHLLQIDKTTGEFSDHVIGDLDKEWEMFKLLRKVYDLKQAIWKD